MVSPDQPFQGEPVTCGFCNIDLAEVVTVAGLVEEWRVLCSRQTYGGKVIEVFWKGWVAELLEGFVGSSTQADGRAFEEAERGV